MKRRLSLIHTWVSSMTILNTWSESNNLDEKDDVKHTVTEVEAREVLRLNSPKGAEAVPDSGPEISI